MESFAAPHSEDNLELKSQVELLKFITETNAKAMDQSGLLDRFFQDPKVANYRWSHLPQVSLSSSESNQDGRVMEYELGIGPIEAHQTTRYCFVTVAIEQSGILAPTLGFTDEDAQLVKNMVKGLKDAKVLNVLPNLSPDCFSIVGAQE